jgi:hypothetical protein
VAPPLPSAWLCVLTLAATDVQDRNPLLPQCAGTHPEGIFGTWFKAPHDHLHDLHNFTTCAVVGGGKSDKQWGANIDANSAVFRFNDAPTRGFESLVRAPQLAPQLASAHSELPLAPLFIVYTQPCARDARALALSTAVCPTPHLFGGHACPTGG